MTFLQLYRTANQNQNIRISITQEDTLQAPLRTIHEQLPIIWHISNTHLEKKPFDIFAIHKLAAADKILQKWTFATTVVSNNCSMTQ